MEYNMDLNSQFAAAAHLTSPSNSGNHTVQIQRQQGATAGNNGQVVMHVTNRVDARVIKTITMSNIGHCAFESIL